ncbi:MAG: hypothetical protein ACRDLL_14285 [Solirubrobacterales bacterium]
MTPYVPFSLPGAEPTFELVDGDRVLVRWTESFGESPESAMLCEGVWSLTDLAAAQRGEADLDIDSIREWPLSEVLATAEARLEGIRARRDQLVNRYPELKAWPR